MTYRELVYMALDALKIHSDDSKFTEDHVIFLLNKYRAYALQQKYSKTLEGVNNSNYQVININLIKEVIDTPPEEYGGVFKKSTHKIPGIIKITLPEVYDEREWRQEYVFTSSDRLTYVGHNRFLKNIKYCAIDKDGYLELKSSKEYIQGIAAVSMSAIFEDPNDAYDFNEDTTDILDRVFPLEAALVPSVLELVLKDLTNGIYKPTDTTNDAQDALSDLAGFLRRNMKSQFQKQIDE
jgi:hypothetical protein